MAARIVTTQDIMTPEEASRDHIRRLQALWDNSHIERDRWRGVLRFYHGGQLAHLRRMPSEEDAHWRHKPKVMTNVLAKIVEARSTLYDRDPVRQMDREDEAPWAERALWRHGEGLTSQLDDALPYVVLTGTVLGLVYYAPDMETPIDVSQVIDGGEVHIDDGVELIRVTRDRFVALEHPDDPRHAQAALIHISTTTHGNGSVVDMFHYWDRFHFAQLVRVVSVPEELVKRSPHIWSAGWTRPDEAHLMPHEYGTMPIVPMRYRRAVDSYMVDGILGPDDDLIEVCRSVNDVLTELLHTAKLQRGQPWVAGEAPKSWLMAPDAPIEVDGPGNFGIESCKANLQGIMDTVRFVLEQMEVTHSLPTGTLVRLARQWESGSALQAAQAIQARTTDAAEALAAHWEKRIHKLAAKVYNRHRGTSYMGDVSIEYVKTPPILDSEQTLMHAQWEHSQGLMGDIEAKRRLHPDMSARDAELLVSEGRIDQERRQRLAVEVAGHAQDTRDEGRDAPQTPLEQEVDNSND